MAQNGKIWTQGAAKKQLSKNQFQVIGAVKTGITFAYL